MKKIVITSLHPVGCTFVDWSICFLSGQTEYYNIDSKSWHQLSRDPVTGINAHGHKKNHPAGYNNTKECLEALDQLEVDGIGIVYPRRNWELLSSDNLEKINKSQIDDYSKIFKLCNDYNTKIVHVDADPTLPLYFMNPRELKKIRNRQLEHESADELRQEFQEIFFNDSVLQWEQLELTDVWDKRERIALSIRPFKMGTWHAPLSLPHLWINSVELFTNTENTLAKIMKYVELSIVPERLTAWIPVCKKWQNIQLQCLEFSNAYRHIVDSVVNNWYYEIDLSFDEEIIIQHCLIYQHNLNLKTWQLEKFPNNTQDLHKLLEPNSHILSEY